MGYYVGIKPFPVTVFPQQPSGPQVHSKYKGMRKQMALFCPQFLIPFNLSVGERKIYVQPPVLSQVTESKADLGMESPDGQIGEDLPLPTPVHSHLQLAFFTCPYPKRISFTPLKTEVATCR